jgi:alkyl sulfatase BDS1-like metallo-beta-lactamase superfamily hydrolase
MAKFPDTETLYDVMRDLFSQVADKNPAAFDDMVKARLTVRFKVNQPTGEITLDGKTRPPKFTYGAFTGRPDIDLDLTAENLDKLLKHEISAQKAVMNGTIKFKGNPMKLNAMLNVLKASNALYPEVLKAHKIE